MLQSLCCTVSVKHWVGFQIHEFQLVCLLVRCIACAYFSVVSSSIVTCLIIAYVLVYLTILICLIFLVLLKGNESGGRHRSRRSSKDLGRSDGTGSYSRVSIRLLNDISLVHVFFVIIFWCGMDWKFKQNAQSLVIYHWTCHLLLSTFGQMSHWYEVLLNRFVIQR
jgi:preprotein translocase subunit SecG